MHYIIIIILFIYLLKINKHAFGTLALHESLQSLKSIRKKGNQLNIN